MVNFRPNVFCNMFNRGQIPRNSDWLLTRRYNQRVITSAVFCKALFGNVKLLRAKPFASKIYVKHFFADFYDKF